MTTSLSETSVTSKERTSVHVHSQQGLSASMTTRTISTTDPEGTTAYPTTQTGTLVTSKEETSMQGLSASVTTHAPPTDILHDSLVLIPGASVSLPCSAPDKTTFRWHHLPFGEDRSTSVYNGDKINPHYRPAARMTVSNCDDRKCTLNVEDVHLDVAGTFICLGTSAYKYWSLTILGR